jgi:serine/threonine-protein kinase
MLQPGKKIGPFVIEKELGAGNMGAVYLARHSQTGARMAIKVMAPNMGSNKTALARFEREAAILKQLRHPNIVGYHGTGRLHGAPLYLMEYIEGESLDHVMQRRGRITWEEVVALGEQLCSGLQHAHEKGIIHRDLKPSNLMVLPDGTVKLTDFGIAKDLDVTQITEANCTVGTAAYMSPEQCRGERNLTLKSDLYSLGIMFYELLTGRKPFQAETPMDMFLQHVNGTFERPSRQVLDIPVWLDTLVCQLLEKKPEQRPLDAATVGQALSQIREKVEAQQSAGVEAAKTRAVDRPRGRPKLDETDKEAARTLLGRKPRKVRSEPFYRKGWFTATAAVVVLLGMGMVVYLVFLKKPSPESLYEQAKTLMASGSPDKEEEARNGPLKDFERYYPDRDDKQAKQMREWADRAWVDWTERDFLRRLRDQITVGVTDEEGTAKKAVKYEDAGEFDDARDQWSKLEKLKSKDDREKRGWGQYAARRLQELKDVEELPEQLRQKIEEGDKRREPYVGKGAEKHAVKALRLELQKERDQARTAWEELKKKYQEEADQRPWFLLAVLKVRELTPDKAP